ncbi:hypothetical protein [Mesorhizobium sp. WSM3859]|uniref:hypothetical protein n=1 Tax=Mesorhizobium sp. WSM3859 TaxID=2029402 RepID=UPI001140CE57|nr:hypothetical protein [Mesorhizobium sp. WSM3859]
MSLILTAAQFGITAGTTGLNKLADIRGQFAGSPQLTAARLLQGRLRLFRECSGFPSTVTLVLAKRSRILLSQGGFNPCECTVQSMLACNRDATN